MQFHVPQFIEVESKIFGPLTLKQFIYLAGGGGLAFIFYKILPLWLAVFFILPSAGLALALAFLKINERPFMKVFESAFYYYVKSKIFIWKKSAPKMQKKEEVKKTEEKPIYMPKLTESKLKELSWTLNVKEKIR